MSPVADWTESALCAQTDPELFFVDTGCSAAPARAVCRSCPVRPECLSEAIRTGEDEGVWGGFAAHARRDIAEKVRAGMSVTDVIYADDAAYYTRQETARVNLQARQARQRARLRERQRCAAANAEGEAA